MITPPSTSSTPLTQAQLLADLRASGLASAEQIDQLMNQAPLTAEACASQWVTQGVLTAFQAEQLLAGRGQTLVLGQYRLLDRLGTGGMGQVYKAEHVLMKRPVALKVIAQQGSNLDPAVVEQFHREVQAVARLCHPNIVTAYDAAEANGIHFLVMEYVEGIDLSRLVGRVGPLPVTRACEYIRQAALGLHYAHEQGLVHRDIKPQNLMVTHISSPARSASEGQSGPSLALRASGGIVKILDFGLACLAGAPLPEQAAPEGVLAGTPDYMAPELAFDSRDTDIRSDLYSLGCTFYFALTGRVPFPGGTWTGKLLRHRFDPPTPLRELRADVPPPLVAMVERLMAKDPSQRYATPGIMAMLLRDWLAVHGDPDGGCQTVPSFCGINTPLDLDSPTGFGVPGSLSPLPVASGRRQRLVAALLLLTLVTIALLTLSLAKRTNRRREAVEGPGPVSLTASPPKPRVRPVPQSGSAVDCFRMKGLSQSLDTPAAVVPVLAGDATAIHGNGPLGAAALNWQGKAPTPPPAPGYRPRLFSGQIDGPPWQALFITDRPLVFLGLAFGRAAPVGEAAQPVSGERAYDITFSEAMLSLAALPDPEARRRFWAWHGKRGVFRNARSWPGVEGQPICVRDPESGRNLLGADFQLP